MSTPGKHRGVGVSGCQVDSTCKAKSTHTYFIAGTLPAIKAGHHRGHTLELPCSAAHRIVHACPQLVSELLVHLLRMCLLRFERLLLSSGVGPGALDFIAQTVFEASSGGRR